MTSLLELYLNDGKVVRRNHVVERSEVPVAYDTAVLRSFYTPHSWRLVHKRISM